VTKIAQGLQDAILKLGIEAVKAGARVDTILLDKTGYDMLWWAATRWASERGTQIPYATQMTVMTAAGNIKIMARPEETTQL
jgi:hypothetical protein